MHSGVDAPKYHLFNQRRKPSFAFEVNAFSFYWLQQPQAGGPLLGPHSKSSAKVSRIRSSQNGKIQSSFFLSYKTTTKVWDFGMGDGDFMASSASQVWRCQRLSCTEIVPPSFPAWRETSVEMEQQKVGIWSGAGETLSWRYFLPRSAFGLCTRSDWVRFFWVVF